MGCLIRFGPNTYWLEARDRKRQGGGEAVGGDDDQDDTSRRSLHKKGLEGQETGSFGKARETWRNRRKLEWCHILEIKKKQPFKKKKKKKKKNPLKKKKKKKKKKDSALIPA